MTIKEATAMCSKCKLRKAKSNPIKGVLIPIDGVYGKCTNPGGVCFEVVEAIKSNKE